MDMQDDSRDPDTIRDTVPIRPLKKRVSRVLVTVALVASGALGVLAARMMRTLSADPAVRERFEAIERMRQAGSDSLNVESTPVEHGADSSAVSNDTVSSAHAVE